MGKRIGLVTSVALATGVIGGLVAYPLLGEAAEHGGTAMGGGSKIVTLSLTKDYTPSPWTHEVGYPKQAIGKLGFGLKNLLLGWTDLFIEPKEASEKGENVLKGVGMGVVHAIENTLGGAVHTATFFLPQIDAPLPEGGTKLLSSS